jgi:hypothetical protein
MAKKTLFLIYFLTAFTIILAANSFAGIPSKKINKQLAEALQSRNPKKVNKCLDKIIKINYLTGIMKIRQHARRMLQLERTKIVRANQVTKKAVQENLVPWVKIDKRTNEYFKKTKVNQKGKDNPLHLYHK